jgi:hypothetical protein
MRWEITAVICFALAVLLEIVDTIIVYMIRGVKRKNDDIIKNEPNKEEVSHVDIHLDNKKKIVNVR